MQPDSTMETEKLHATGGRVVGVSMTVDNAVVTVEGGGVYLYEVSSTAPRGLACFLPSMTHWPSLLSPQPARHSSEVGTSRPPGACDQERTSQPLRSSSLAVSRKRMVMAKICSSPRRCPTLGTLAAVLHFLLPSANYTEIRSELCVLVGCRERGASSSAVGVQTRKTN